MKDYKNILLKLNNSPFRSKFKLSTKDKQYITDKGLENIQQHAKDFIQKRITPDFIKNDGKQTPMQGHPVFIAQHATACCCRSCIYKWHKISAGRKLTETEQTYLVELIMTWIKHEISR